jgi:hypothetical protein
VTISSSTTRQTFQGNSAQTVFNYTFLLPTAGQYALYYTDADGDIEFVLQSAYTISGVGNPAGGSITYTRGGNPIATGTLLTITRDIPYTQTTELNNQGAYYPGVIEAALDRLDMQIQQLNTLIGLAPKAPITNSPLADMPTIDERRSKYAVFDVDGNLTATDASPSPSALGSLQISGAQDIDMQPTGNPVDTLSSLTVTGETESETVREFLVSIGLTSNKGSGAASPQRDKVALYAGVIADSGTGDVWSLNTVLSLFPGAASYNALGYELDFNNLNGHRGDIPGASGLAAPVGYGLAITGVASYRSTSAFLITGSGASTWNRGITITSGTVQASIQDVSTAERAIDLQGSYDYAIDVSESVNSEAAIQMGWGQKLRGRTSADANIQLIGVSASDQVVVGDNGVPVVVAGTALVPNVDNTIPFGSGSFRWTEIFAANGTINTSDARQKSDMAPLPAMTDLVREVQPISFKFKQGGADIETVTEQQLLPVYETVAIEKERTVVGEDGKARVEKYQGSVRRKVYDEVPVVDADGQQIIDWTKPVVQAGRVVHPAVAVPRVHLVPRMAMQPVEVQKVTPRPGARKHYGFAAGDIDAALKKLGLGDVGVFVKSDGVEGLRMDQLVAVLWQAMREMDERVQEIEDAL